MNDDLKLRVGLEDKVTAGLKQIAKEINSLANNIGSSSSQTRAASTSFGKLTASIITADLAVRGFTTAIGAVKQAFVNSITAVNEYNSAMSGLSSVAAAFGEDQNEARDAAVSLAKDGLMSVTDAAAGLKNLLGTGFSMPEAINLMNAFKDTAAFNRQGTLEFGQAIVGATQGIKNQNSIMVDNVGITKNLSIILEEAGYSQQDLMRVQTDASVRQALYNGLLREGAVFSGDAARAADNLQGAMSQLNTATKMLNVSIGQMLAPALTLIVGELTNAANSSNQTLQPALSALSKTMVIVAEGALMMGEAVRWAAASAIQLAQGASQIRTSLDKLDFKGVANSTKGVISSLGKEWDTYGKNVGRIYGNAQKTLDQITTKGLSSFQVQAKSAVGSIGNAVAEGAGKVKDKLAEMAGELEKLASDYGRKVSQMASQFNESLKDLVIRHRDRMKELEKQIGEENESFSERMSERKEDFDETMADLEKRHKEKVDQITAQMREEEEKNREVLEQFKIAANERLASLQVQLDRERRLGRHANDERVRTLEQMIQNERESLDEQLALKQETNEELEAELVKENEEFLKAKAEREAEYAKETEKLRAEHEKRFNSLQSELNAEREIQRKHAEDFARFQNAVAEDDITRLKSKHAEQRAEEERAHQERLADIARRVQEERATRDAAQVKTSSGTLQSYQSAASQIASQANKTSQVYSTPIRYSTPIKWVNGKPVAAYADGGIVDRPTFGMIGERGPEAVIPLSRPNRAAQIMQQTGLTQTDRNITVNMPVTVMSSEVDIDYLLERLAFKLDKGGML